MEVLGCFLISKGLSNSHFLMKFVSRRMKREVGPSFFSSTFFFLGILAVAVDRRGPPSDQTALVSFGLPDTGGDRAPRPARGGERRHPRRPPSAPRAFLTESAWWGVAAEGAKAGEERRVGDLQQ